MMDKEELKESIDFDFFDGGTLNGDNLMKSVSRNRATKSNSIGSNLKLRENKKLNRDPENSDSDHQNRTYAASESGSDYERNNNGSQKGSARSVSSRSTVSQLSVKIPSAQNGHESGQSENDERKSKQCSPEHVKILSCWDSDSKQVDTFNEENNSANNKRKARLKSAKTRRRVNNNLSSSDEDSSDDDSYSSKSSASYSSRTCSSEESESDSDVTDVSPLHTPEYPQSPRNGDADEFRYKSHSESKQSSRPKSHKKSGVRFEEIAVPGQSIHGRRLQERETDDKELSMLLRAVLELDETPSKYDLNSLQRKLRPSSGRSTNSTLSSQSRRGKQEHMPHHRMNISFSNDEVRRIDRENQRLLHNIIATKPSTPASTCSGHSRKSKHTAPSSHSALRRQRDQRRIESENLKILERIQSAKASSVVQKDRLLKDHHKQVQYANQVAKSPVRPSSGRKTGKAYAAKMAKASSMSSLSSDWSRTTSASGSVWSRPSSGKTSLMEEPMRGNGKPAWDERWQSHY